MPACRARGRPGDAAGSDALFALVPSGRVVPATVLLWSRSYIGLRVEADARSAQAQEATQAGAGSRERPPGCAWSPRHALCSAFRGATDVVEAGLLSWAQVWGAALLGVVGPFAQADYRELWKQLFERMQEAGHQRHLDIARVEEAGGQAACDAAARPRDCPCPRSPRAASCPSSEISETMGTPRIGQRDGAERPLRAGAAR